MNIDLTNLIKPNQTVAVALSGGSDSMALLYYMNKVSKKFPFNLVAINVEHGIRAEESKQDTEFAKNYCEKNGIPIYLYQVDCPKKAEEEKLSLEQAGRLLRYECFFDAINTHKCDKVATAHHADDNVESVLFNLLRGTGAKGVSGIKDNFEDKIIRPFLAVDKAQIERYVRENNIPFVTDKTNFCDDYTRNNLRLNVIPKIKEIFPEMAKSIRRFSEISSIEDQYLDQVANDSVKVEKDAVKIPLPLHTAILSRAVIIALKALGTHKDYEKAHIDSVVSLATQENGNKVCLPKNIVAIKEYDALVLYKDTKLIPESAPFALGKTKFLSNSLTIEKVELSSVDIKSGLYADLDKIPKTAMIRTKKDGDVFNKFGGGTKSLGDYFTDKKIPLRKRDFIPLLADGNEVLCIFNVAISDKIKIDEFTKTVVMLKLEEE